MESIIGKINNFIGNDNLYYDSDDNVLDDSIDDIEDIDQSNYFLGLFKKNIYEFGKKKGKKNQKTKAERNRSKIGDSIMGKSGDKDSVGKYNYSKLIRFSKKDPLTKTVKPEIHNNNADINHCFAITQYGAAILRDIHMKYKGDTPLAIVDSGKDKGPTGIKYSTGGWLTNVDIDMLVNQQGGDPKKGFKIGRILSVLPSENVKTLPKHVKEMLGGIESTRSDIDGYIPSAGGNYTLEKVPVEGDKDGYTWIEARGPDNPPRLRYYKIMMFASDLKNTKLNGGKNKADMYNDGWDTWPSGWGWFHNRAAGCTDLAADFNFHGMHVSPKRSNTSSEFWNTPGRVASETWFPPISKASNPAEGASTGSGTINTFLTNYAIQEAFYPNNDKSKGVNTPDIFDKRLEWSLVSTDDLDAAMIAADDFEFNAEMFSNALAERKKKMKELMSTMLKIDPLENLKSKFLYDNILTIHIGGSSRDNGGIKNPWLTEGIYKPSFYKTVTQVTPNSDEIMTNFINDVKERTIYICSNVLLGISICFLPYIKFPILDVLVHSLAYIPRGRTVSTAQMPLTSKWAALLLSYQTSLITTLKTNAAPLCSVIGLAIITATLPTIHYKPSDKEKAAIHSSFSGLIAINATYMVLGLFPPLAPNLTIEQALYNLFFPPGVGFDKVLERMPGLVIFGIVQFLMATHFLVFNIWFICMVPAVCLLLFPLFRTLARYLGGNLGEQAATMIDRISDSLVEPSVNSKDSDTGLSMMDLVTKIILVLAVCFIFAEFFDAVNDHFGLSTLLSNMVNSFRNVTEIIPEILLVFFIVMTFSKAIKSTSDFNKVAGKEAKWDAEEKQKLADGKNPAWAAMEYCLFAFKDAFLMAVGLLGTDQLYKSSKEKEMELEKKEIEKEIAAMELVPQNAEIDIRKAALDHAKEVKKADLLAEQQRVREVMQGNNRRAKRLFVFREKREKVKNDFEKERLKSIAQHDKATLEDKIKYAMFLNAGTNQGVNPIQIAQMSKLDPTFANALNTAIATGSPLNTIVSEQLTKLQRMKKTNASPAVDPLRDQPQDPAAPATATAPVSLAPAPAPAPAPATVSPAPVLGDTDAYNSAEFFRR